MSEDFGNSAGGTRSDVGINYKTMPAHARQMQELGGKLNSELSTAWTSVTDLRSTWYGVRYNSLISLFNNVKDSVNEMLTLVVCTIPEQCGTIARNYSIVDGEPVPQIDAGSINPIDVIENSDTTRMNYEEGPAAACKEAVSANFDKAEVNMNEIVTEFDQIDWTGEIRENYKSQLTNVKSRIEEALENIKTQFGTLMAEASEDMERVANANDVSQG